MNEIFELVDRPLEQTNAEDLLIKLLDARRALSQGPVDFDFSTLSATNKQLVLFSTVNALINVVKQRL